MIVKKSRPLHRLAMVLALAGATGVTASAQNLYVANFGNNTVSEFGPTGGLTNAAFASGASLSNPSGLAFDRAGNLYVASHNGIGQQTVSEFDAAGNLITGSFVSSSSTLEGLAFDTNGYFYAVNSSANQVLKFDATGKNLLQTISSTNFDSPIGIAFDTGGNFYVPNRGNGKVLKFDPAGNPANGEIFASGLNEPEGVAFDSRGNLYVASFQDGTVSKFDASGNLVNASFASGLSHPIGVAFDYAGNLYVANFAGNTVSKFDSNGNLVNASFISGLNSPSYLAFRGISLPVSPLPAVTVTNAGGEVVVSWPLTPGFTLQQTSDLQAGNWTASSYPITTNGAMGSVTLESPTGNLFFRLSHE
jgi:DNA-binding beta-propeller fold protein YncE